MRLTATVENRELGQRGVEREERGSGRIVGAGEQLQEGKRSSEPYATSYEEIMVPCRYPPAELEAL
jgi:hypothetical protein